jgi:lysyl-tRNA synthetase class 2
LEQLEILQARAALLAELRQFFSEEQVLEVDTPLLYSSTTTDPYINHLSLSVQEKKFFLQSSPEFAMKRLLADVKVSMYQICKAFRGDEVGSKHNIEFTMLEWYMVNFSLEQLLGQTETLLKRILGVVHSTRLSYREAFLNTLGIDPFSIELQDLFQVLSQKTTAVNISSFSKDECLHLLFAEHIEQSFDPNVLTYIYDFPESQAALAQSALDEFGNNIAKRFEIYCSGIELANAYQEEANPEVLIKRFETENTLRKASSKEEIPVDTQLLESLKSFPDCSGIAMGFDRLLLLKLSKTSLKEINFFHEDMSQ